MAQAQAAGLNWWQVQNIIQTALNNALYNPWDPAHPFPPVLGPDGRKWKMTGGFFNGYTDNSGNVWIDFSAAGFSGVLSFVYVKMPYPGRSHFGYVYHYEEDQLVLLGLSVQGALIQFIEDIVVDRRANVCMTWMALGI